MPRKLTLTLATALMMFPQIVETIYSPALTDIARGLRISPAMVGQTLSVYFFAFAFGVVFWGRMCDVIGRRPAILAGLTLYTLASMMALFSHSFSLLLSARVLAAFGVAVGSVGTQTAMRDSFSGHQLARIFSLMGMAMAISPAIGVFSGAVLTYFWGYQGVFAALAWLAVILWLYSFWQLPETRPRLRTTSSFWRVLVRMIRDADILRSALLIALFNTTLFSYYQLAPFEFEQSAAGSHWFGYSGLILAAGTGIGAYINRYLLDQKWPFAALLILSSLLAVTGGGLLWLLSGTLYFFLPMLLVVMAYGIAIPNLLARALRHYTDCMGSAGALLGLLYYLLLGIGLAIAGGVQHLGVVLTISGLLIALLSGMTIAAGRALPGRGIP